MHPIEAWRCYLSNSIFRTETELRSGTLSAREEQVSRWRLEWLKQLMRHTGVPIL